MATHREAAHGGRSIGTSPLTITKGECLGCATELPVYTLQCNCLYCQQCLELLFRSAINRGRFPAACCQDVSIADYVTILPQDLVQFYLQREEEFGTRNETYCHNPRCSTFLSQRGIARGIRKCPKCGENTCETCKQAEHSGPCVQDESSKEVLEYGNAQGWKKCNGCGHLVEKTDGFVDAAINSVTPVAANGSFALVP
ncbi:hypothetical protein ANO14919_024940 [Xylariales sp. No.14919]|nr:hypothetical protein ANO14919_024940 [Xylariales sp. No.14919]